MRQGGAVHRPSERQEREEAALHMSKKQKEEEIQSVYP